MIRTDGEFVIYIIQHKYLKKGKWTYSAAAGNFFPDYYDNKEGWYYLKSFQKCVDACQDCWQQTGIHGSYSKLLVIAFCDALTKLNPKHEFRAAELKISQATRGIYTS